MKKLNKLLNSGACKGSSSIPFDERPSVDRRNLGPFVRGYVERMLEDFPFYDLSDIDEPTLQQIVRDCVGFYWRNRKILEDPFTDYDENEIGACFYASRNALRGGFMTHYRIDGFRTFYVSAVLFGPLEVEITDTNQLSAIHLGQGWYQ